MQSHQPVSGCYGTVTRARDPFQIVFGPNKCNKLRIYIGIWHKIFFKWHDNPVNQIDINRQLYPSMLSLVSRCSRFRVIRVLYEWRKGWQLLTKYPTNLLHVYLEIKKASWKKLDNVSKVYWIHFIVFAQYKINHQIEDNK